MRRTQPLGPPRCYVLLAIILLHLAPAFLVLPVSGIPLRVPSTSGTTRGHLPAATVWPRWPASVMKRRGGAWGKGSSHQPGSPSAQYEHLVSSPPSPPGHPQTPRNDSVSGGNFALWLLNWPKNDLFPEVRFPVLLNMAWSGLLAWLHHKGHVQGIHEMPHNLLSGTLGFFLTFRANEGYGRCCAAREIWDGVLNSSRAIVRMMVAAEPLIGTERARRIVDLTSAYGVVLEEHVCMTSRPHELEVLLRPSDLVALSRTSNRPLAIVELLSEECMRAGKESKEIKTSVHYPRLLNFIDALGSYVTRCERLMKAPLPPAYYGHALRFLSVWTFTLPFALLNKMPGPALVPCMGVVTWALFGLREIGVKAMLPFHLPQVVNMNELWKEVVWDARATFEAARAAREAEENSS